ncbi:hypothetical protein L485_04765 [Sphingobium baderi LL03]|uniref:Uncharacterized protein n=1 Tax=Sphingobium baderi LL03 TaxID=1114964 RepID=T0HXD9_9SPHN|nr:hypothetical protein L485_04765 [Sphingobium baderi LL03]
MSPLRISRLHIATHANTPSGQLSVSVGRRDMPDTNPNPVLARLVLFALTALIADVVTVAIEFGPILRGQWF